MNETGCATKTPELRRIPNELETLQKTIVRLDENICELASRLAPVCDKIPPPLEPLEPSEIPPERALPALAVEIACKERAVSLLADAVSTLLMNLEL